MAEKSAKDNSSIIFVVIVLLLTLVGAGAGLSVGSLLQATPVNGESEKQPETAGNDVGQSDPKSADRASDKGADEHSTAPQVPPESDGDLAEAEGEAEEFLDPHSVKTIPFPPVLTTLAEPKGKWIRLEGSLLISSEAHSPPELLAEKLGEQILAYLRTLRLDQIEGPAGLSGLREDLNELVRIMSNGDAKAILIHGLVVE